jgi:Karyopherin (importin) alpha
VTQACWVMYKIIKSSNESQAKQLYYLKAFETVCELLEDPEARILRIVLDCIYEFLRIGDQFLDQDGENFFVLALGETKDLDKLENLQDHPQESIRKKALNILETFFEPDE